MSQKSVFEAIRTHLPRLTKSESGIGCYILNNEAKIGLETGVSLAAATEVSEITISRFLSKLGLRGVHKSKEQFKMVPRRKASLKAPSVSHGF